MNIQTFLKALREGDLSRARAYLHEHRDALAEELDAASCPDALGRGRSGNRALAVAAYYGHRAMLDLLLDAGAVPAHRNAEGRTALHVALEHNFEAAKHLVQRGVRKDVVACACLHDHEGLRSLLQADSELANDRSTGLSALGWATYYGALRAAEILAEFGARGDDGELLCAAGTANVQMAEFLLRLGVDVNAPHGADGRTALHVAAAHEYTDDATAFVRFLLDRGADPSVVAGPAAITPLELARRRREEQSSRGVRRGQRGWCNYTGVIAILETIHDRD